LIVVGTLTAVGELWSFYAEPEPISEARVRAGADGDVVGLGDRELRTRHAPGHATHRVVYHDPANDATFTGDAAEVWMPEREQVRSSTPPWSSDLEKSLAVETIRGLDPGTLLYPHFRPHPDPDTVLDEVERVLVEGVEAVETKRPELGDDEGFVEHFVSTTPTVDAWGEAMPRPVTAVDVRGVLDYLDGRDQ
jgi:glyoxylase-like metal-dependent hydrolase (beta-lactamase superfamily II)